MKKNKGGAAGNYTLKYMTKIILCIFSLLILLIVQLDGQLSHKNKLFIPDTSINNVLNLLDPESVRKIIGDQSGKLIDDNQQSRIQFENKDGSQYLIMYHLNGSNANSFNVFEIGFLRNKNIKFKKINFDAFSIANGIELGITKKELVNIKGPGFINIYHNDVEIMEYKIDKNNSPFLQKYNMPLYVGKYFFRKGKLIKIIFGFPNL